MDIKSENIYNFPGSTFYGEQSTGKGSMKVVTEDTFEQRLEGRGRDRIDIRGIRVLGLGNTQCKGGVLACSGKSEEVKVG